MLLRGRWKDVGLIYRTLAYVQLISPVFEEAVGAECQLPVRPPTP